MTTRPIPFKLCVLLVLLLGCDEGKTHDPGLQQTAGGSASGSGFGGSGIAAGGSAAGSSSGGVSPAAGSGGGPTMSAGVVVSGAAPLPVAPTFFGQNYWSWVPDWGDPVAAVVGATAELELGLLRAGGANNDRQDPVTFSLAEVDDFVAFSREVGAEPLLQVPLIKTIEGGVPTAQDAAELVTYVNVTKAYGIKYFSIGNEPDLYEEQQLKPAGYDAAQFCTSFREYAAAMRAVDPTIQLVGPDLSWKYTTGANDWLTPFLEQCGDVTDIVAVHRYPLAPTACTEAAAYADVANYRTMLARVKAIMLATGQQAKPLALTEANITWEGDPEGAIMGASPGTFPAALWVADNLGASLEAGLYSVDYWSLSEGWTLGFFDGAAPRPAFHVLKMFSNHFGSESLSVTGAPSGISVYAGRDSTAARTSLFVVNTSASRVELDVSFTDHPLTRALQLAVAPASLQLAILPEDGAAPTVFSYAAGMAEPALLPP